MTQKLSPAQMRALDIVATHDGEVRVWHLQYGYAIQRKTIDSLVKRGLLEMDGDIVRDVVKEPLPDPVPQNLSHRRKCHLYAELLFKMHVTARYGSRATKHLARQYGWTYLGSGASRMAFRAPDGAVYKIGKDSQSITEYQVHRKLRGRSYMPESVKLYTFSETEEYSPLIYVVRMTHYDNSGRRRESKEHWDLIDSLEREGLKDLHGGNYVITADGQLKVIDLGFGHRLVKDEEYRPTVYYAHREGLTIS